MENKISKLELLGDRVIVLLDKAEDHTTTDGGVIIPLFENAETDGGRPTSKLSMKRYLSVGTVLAISATAQEKIPTISVGDRVYVTPSSASSNYQFLPDRTQLVEDWSGMISISHVLVEAKIKEQ
jgi:co-chaperonin GroES (HSP10)